MGASGLAAVERAVSVELEGHVVTHINRIYLDIVVRPIGELIVVDRACATRRRAVHSDFEIRGRITCVGVAVIGVRAVGGIGGCRVGCRRCFKSAYAHKKREHKSQHEQCGSKNSFLKERLIKIRLSFLVRQAISI